MKKSIYGFKELDQEVLQKTNGGGVTDYIQGFIYELLRPSKRK